ncbi:MAG TPA: hypothetical protein VH589_08755 [Trebonia sp.]|jgi:hypothetical protein
MSSPITARRRAVPLTFAVLLAVLAGLVTLTTQREAAHASDATGHDHAKPTGLPKASQVAFHDQMRKLWEDHVTWTRLAIVTFADGSAGFGATATRLLQNQTDIGNAVAPFYGTAAGQHLSGLLHDHITIAVELLQDAKAGDTAAFNDAKSRWYANANQIADFLSAANPRFWPDAVMREAMKEHLDQTLAEAVGELSGNYAASVTDYEAIHLHILAMADLLSSGIMQQFPARFR